jgi:hypothetical protein
VYAPIDAPELLLVILTEYCRLLAPATPVPPPLGVGVGVDVPVGVGVAPVPVGVGVAVGLVVEGLLVAKKKRTTADTTIIPIRNTITSSLRESFLGDVCGGGGGGG